MRRVHGYENAITRAVRLGRCKKLTPLGHTFHIFSTTKIAHILHFRGYSILRIIRDHLPKSVTK